MFDKSTNKDLIKKLASFDLSERDALVYLALLDIGVAVGSSKIITRTGLHGQYVYQSLTALEQHGLVQHSIVRGRKKFVANPPERLKFLVEEKRVLADQLVEDLQSLSRKSIKHEFAVYEGDTAFVQHEFDMLEQAEYGDTMQVIGATGDRFFALLSQGQQERYNSLRVKKQIDAQFIGSPEQRNYLESVTASYEKFSFRILPGYPSGVVNTIIRPKSVTFYQYTDPVFAYAVYSREVAKSQQDFFVALWERCEE